MCTDYSIDVCGSCFCFSHVSPERKPSSCTIWVVRVRPARIYLSQRSALLTIVNLRYNLALLCALTALGRVTRVPCIGFVLVMPISNYREVLLCLCIAG